MNTTRRNSPGRRSAGGRYHSENEPRYSRYNEPYDDELREEDPDRDYYEEDEFDDNRMSARYRDEGDDYFEGEGYYDDEDRDNRYYAREYDDDRYLTRRGGNGRGFASMDRDDVSEIGRRGRTASHRGSSSQRVSRDSDGRRAPTYRSTRGRSTSTGRRSSTSNGGRSSASDSRSTAGRATRSRTSSRQGNGRGFASMGTSRLREVSARGGRSSHGRLNGNGRRSSASRSGSIQRARSTSRSR